MSLNDTYTLINLQIYEIYIELISSGPDFTQLNLFENILCLYIIERYTHVYFNKYLMKCFT